MNGPEVLRKFLESLESVDCPKGSPGKKNVDLVINGELAVTTENFICGISFAPNRTQQEQGKLILGFSDNIPGAEKAEKVDLVICLNSGEFRFALKYLSGYGAWMLKVPCEYSTILRDNLDWAVKKGAVRIEVETKNHFLSKAAEEKGDG
ncbi:MAG: hypothetical protein COV69_03290 [Parcubacteria group bacterium CG11_big_fil_rev_8_21_14_0_20_39_14]|nr:MAG: hypothetical protein COV69_03290 [Parcubacteria group bacterium CG11_big_fil_rev_8_21_14_0_20_39_14]PIS35517.1 MAG: hypothetical protein COT36_02005 [Parcubacteria group bacterium CG08_land_8_20_14_0_20_38_56]